MTVYSVFQAALASTGYPVTQPPVVGSAPVYLAFFEVFGRFDMYASNDPHRIVHQMQVDIFSRLPAIEELETVIETLRAAGIRVRSWGPSDYEKDTRWHHVAVMCSYAERIDNEGGITDE